MEQRFLDEIQELAKTKPCILIHFGNPLALKYLGELSDFEAIVCAYQGFVEVHRVVAKLIRS
uniref:hypothetical protein n=1 Tax=Algoriphagus sp. TaxID=1872435 RepID=UPI004047888C